MTGSLTGRDPGCSKHSRRCPHVCLGCRQCAWDPRFPSCVSFHAAASLLILLVLASPVKAQEPVNRVADAVSWGTALANPTIAVVDAIRSNHPACKLAQLGVTAGILVSAVMATKQFVQSERPCLGCAPDGWPSGHTAFSGLGASGWRYGFVLTTGALRWTAHRHTPPQIGAGALYAEGAKLGGEKVVRCST